MSITDVTIIDIEGNDYKIDFYKSSSPHPDLVLNVPIKLTFSFKDVKNEPLFLKLFRFKTNSNSEKSPLGGIRSNIELRDIKVLWN
ncbi:hypothetical protein NBC122_02777 [Chryseobacterium salivictor]|uniref:Uncharacterized protein n=1 Tax=Chryseobacterium salivictor TaxID=2547600 RepID=A0A4P6ZIV8_9FLAO|nr:hypothetical protein NBC122_02777 [Chryseobacterium salivictor]